MATAEVRVLRAGERSASPWKNGGGVTREVAAFPEGADLGEFHWRVSLADVARGGPFSAFPGIDRVITVVRGGGMVLTVDGTDHVVDEPYRPFAFSGDADTDCRLLEGALVDFNVMTRRGTVTARVDIVRGTTELTGPTVLAILFEGSAVLRPHDGGDAPEHLQPLDAVLLAGGGTVLEVDGTAAMVVLSPAG